MYAAECVVQLVDDRLYEEDEQFRLILGSPDSPELSAALVGRQNVTMVTIKDQGDGEFTAIDIGCLSDGGAVEHLYNCEVQDAKHD